MSAFARTPVTPPSLCETLAKDQSISQSLFCIDLDMDYGNVLVSYLCDLKISWNYRYARSSDSVEAGHPHGANKAKNVMSVGAIVVGDNDERKLLGKIDLRVLPTITIVYMLAFLDR